MIYNVVHVTVVCYYILLFIKRKLFLADLLITPSSILFSSGVLVISKSTVHALLANSINRSCKMHVQSYP